MSTQTTKAQSANTFNPHPIYLGTAESEKIGLPVTSDFMAIITNTPKPRKIGFNANVSDVAKENYEKWELVDGDIIVTPQEQAPVTHVTEHTGYMQVSAIKAPVTQSAESQANDIFYAKQIFCTNESLIGDMVNMQDLLQMAIEHSENNGDRITGVLFCLQENMACFTQRMIDLFKEMQSTNMLETIN